MSDGRCRRTVRVWRAALLVAGVVALGAHPAAADPAPAADEWLRMPPAETGAAAGTFTVVPTTGLAYATEVTVTASGYPPGSLFGALECVADATDIGDCAGPTFLIGTVDGTGSYRGTTTVRRFVATTDGIVDCAAAAGTCVMAGGPSFGDALLDTRPLTFDPRAPIPPPPTIIATPDSGLGLETAVTVTGSGFPPRGSAAILQCLAGTDDLAACGQTEYASAAVDATGHISTIVQVRRGMRTADDPLVDCAVAPGCVLVGFDAGDPTRRAYAPLAFDPTVPVPPPPVVTAEPSTGLADRQLVTVSATGFRPGQIVYLGQCAAGSVGAQTCGTVQTQAADPDGAVARTIRVRRAIGSPPVDCAAAPGACVAFAAATDDVFAAASVPLTFDPAAPPVALPTVTVEPTDGLHDGQTVTVTGAGFTPGEQVALVQCRAGAVDDAGRGCDLSATLVYRSADPSGSLHTTFTVRQVLQTLGDGAVDCALASPGCFVGWGGLSDLEYERGQVAIRFGPTGGADPTPPPPPAAVPPPPATTAPVPLAMTGADPGPTARLGVVLALLGAACLLLTRRRRRPAWE